jgi:hypothetical protein
MPLSTAGTGDAMVIARFGDQIDARRGGAADDGDARLVDNGLRLAAGCRRADHESDGDLT